MTTDTQNKTAEETSHMRHVILMVAVVIFGSCFGNLSQTALNAMFSGMATDFGVDVGLGQWVTTLYMLVLGITVPVVTYLMRRFSLKSVILGSLVLLLIGGLIDAVAWNFPILIVGRVLQAISAGITMPMMMSLIMMTFPRNQQATAMGIAGIAMGFAPNIGPTIGGWMLESFGWRSFFVALTACTALLIVFAIFVIQKTAPGNKEYRLDVISLIQSALGFGGLLLGFSNASSYGLENPLIWVPVTIGAVFLVLFVRRQRRVEVPLINMGIFDSKRFRLSFWMANFLYASFMGITLIIPLYIENLWGGSAFQAGLALLPGTVAAFIINPLAGILTDKIGARPVITIAAFCLVAGAAMMVFVDENTPFWVILAMQSVRATGVSGLIGPLNSWGMGELPHGLMTDASSFGTAVRQACASLGTALMVYAIVAGPFLGSVAMGYHVAFGFSAVCALVVFVLALARVRSDK